MHRTAAPRCSFDAAGFFGHWIRSQSPSPAAVGDLGRAQLPLWAERNPRSPWEDDTVREPLFAAWIVLLANDSKLNQPHAGTIRDLLLKYDWSGLYTASFFIAVNIQYESSRPPDF